MDTRPVFVYIGARIMAGNTRGKLKEHCEGIQKNFSWITYHCEKMLGLIQDKNPNLTNGVKAVDEGCKIIDKGVQDIYSKL